MFIVHQLLEKLPKFFKKWLLSSMKFQKYMPSCYIMFSVVLYICLRTICSNVHDIERALCYILNEMELELWHWNMPYSFISSGFSVPHNTSVKHGWGDGAWWETLLLPYAWHGCNSRQWWQLTLIMCTRKQNG